MTIFGARDKEDIRFLIIEDKGTLKEWIVSNGFEYSVYEQKEEEAKHTLFRLLRDSKAIVGFVPNSKPQDRIWNMIASFVKMGKGLYLVYDEFGELWRRSPDRIRTKLLSSKSYMKFGDANGESES
jgi:hypothetical protein